VSLQKGEIWIDRYTGKCHVKMVKMKAEIRELPPGTKQHKILPENHQKLEERHETDSFS
jgi:hypothetical protein